jgi:hypothetical protein
MTKLLSAVLAVTVLSGLLAGCDGDGFQQEDIKDVTTAITQDYNNRPGVKVVDLQMLITGSDVHKMEGFMKLEVDGEPVQADCSATMGTNNQFIWKCDPING